MGLKELPPNVKRDAPTLAELINRAFRLRGRLHEGTRVLALPELATIILGPAWQGVDTRPIAEALISMGLRQVNGEYLWRPHVTGHTRTSDHSLLEAYGEAKPSARLHRAVRRQWVPMHLRRLTYYEPSQHKRLSYSEARQRYGMYGVLPTELLPDCTWVEPYDWSTN